VSLRLFVILSDDRVGEFMTRDSRSLLCQSTAQAQYDCLNIAVVATTIRPPFDDRMTEVIKVTCVT